MYLPALLRFWSFAHPGGVAMRIEATTPERQDAGRSPLGFQFEMTSEQARLLARQLTAHADDLDAGVTTEEPS
jgi:hypothetical protein